ASGPGYRGWGSGPAPDGFGRTFWRRVGGYRVSWNVLPFAGRREVDGTRSHLGTVLGPGSDGWCEGRQTTMTREVYDSAYTPVKVGLHRADPAHPLPPARAVATGRRARSFVLTGLPYPLCSNRRPRCNIGLHPHVPRPTRNPWPRASRKKRACR